MRKHIMITAAAAAVAMLAPFSPAAGAVAPAPLRTVSATQLWVARYNGGGATAPTRWP